jgi:flagellar assembly protein FliH
MTLLSELTPKERQTAYQRWELASFGEVAQPAAPVPAPPSLSEFAQQIAEARESARAEGYAAGLEQGKSAGLQQGREQAEQERQALMQIAAGFGNALAHANETVASELLNLALDLAKAMLKTALAVHPEHVLAIVGEAIRYLPSIQQPALLFLHPADAELAREQMADELAKAGWRIVPDAQMERGGCRVETASNQIDAAVPVRWQRLAAALGVDADWLA